MSTQYVQLENGTLRYMPAPTHVSNPTESYLASYAAEQSYKELRTSTASSIYHTRSYRDYDSYIAEIWTKPSLSSLQASLKQEAEDLKTQQLQASTTLEIDEVGSVIYDTQAVQNVTSLIVLNNPDAEAYILADDSVLMATQEQIQSIAQAFKAHVESIYTEKIARFAAIDAAESTDELLASLT